jgi:hypothetical protein
LPPGPRASASSDFFSDPKNVPRESVIVYSGLIPNQSRAPNSTRSWLSQIRNANMPRSRDTHCSPQYLYAARMTSPSPSVAKLAAFLRTSS